MAELTKDLKEYDGLTWERAKKKLGRERIRLLFHRDPLLIEVAKTFDSHGEDAGTASLCAYVYCEACGEVNGIRRAIEIYREAYKGSKSKWIQGCMDDMEFWISYTSGGVLYGKEWPIKPMVTDDKDKLCGLANVLFLIACRRLDGRGNAETFLAQSVAKFLKEGMEKKDAKRSKQVV